MSSSFPGYLRLTDLFIRTITLTRKMFTMLLSVFMYDHKLTPGQWAGAGVVFAGISVEAYVKRKGAWRVDDSPSQLLTSRCRSTRKARDPREGESKHQAAIDS